MLVTSLTVLVTSLPVLVTSLPVLVTSLSVLVNSLPLDCLSLLAVYPDYEAVMLSHVAGDSFYIRCDPMTEIGPHLFCLFGWDSLSWDPAVLPSS